MGSSVSNFHCSARTGSGFIWNTTLAQLGGGPRYRQFMCDTCHKCQTRSLCLHAIHWHAMLHPSRESSPQPRSQSSSCNGNQERLKQNIPFVFKHLHFFGFCRFSAMPKSNNPDSTAASATAARRTISKNSCSSVLQRVKSFADIKKRGTFKSPSEVHCTI